MILENSVFVGVGQCGGNIAWSIEQKEGMTYYINTAAEDLDCIPTDSSKKYHIPGAAGTAKNEEIAKEILFQNNILDSLCNNIHSRYANSKVITFGFSAGGGTGGTMTNYIMEVMKDLFPEKIINATVVLPSKNEDMVIQLNALRCLKHLNELYKKNIVNSIQLLDNNKGSYEKINEDFSIVYTQFLKFESFDKNGNFDTEEQYDVITIPGAMAMYEFGSDGSYLDQLMKSVENSVFFKLPKIPTIIGLITNKSIDTEEALLSTREVIGFSKLTHSSTWEEDSNIVISAGVDFGIQYDLIEHHLKTQISELDSERRKSEEIAMKEIQDLKKPIELDIDTDSFMNLRKSRNNNVQTSNNEAPKTYGRRRRSSSTNLREKYRNL